LLNKLNFDIGFRISDVGFNINYEPEHMFRLFVV